ncbi:acyl carrier protein [Paenibacillus larvae]|nr:acyl carrier protein [Paenibacillus larvae]MDT2194527.1 acyl carrier protein [Paenibacillus larvae]MDT2237067.1 acyl carrier protein [Paenibacillus larvae]
MDHKKNIELTIKKLISNVTGISVDELDSHAHFIGIGLDSIILDQIKKAILDEYNVDIPMESFFDSMNNIDSVVEYVAEATASSLSVHHEEHVKSPQPAMQKCRSSLSGMNNPAQPLWLPIRNRHWKVSLLPRIN